MQFYKVKALPANPVPGAFYYINDDTEFDTFAEAYLTDREGVPKKIGNSDMIQSIVSTNISAMNFVTIVPDIEARDNLVLGEKNQVVYVEDASGDPQVTTGPATYIWNKTSMGYIRIINNVGGGLAAIDGGNF